MDFTPYLRELEYELALLKTVRRMLMELREPMLTPQSPAQQTLRPIVDSVVDSVVAEHTAPEPHLTVVPPRQRREYHRRSRGPVEQRAIGAPIPQTPVFVKPAVVVAAAPAPKAEPELDAAALEAAMRRKLLGQVA